MHPATRLWKACGELVQSVPDDVRDAKSARTTALGISDSDGHGGAHLDLVTDAPRGPLGGLEAPAEHEQPAVGRERPELRVGIGPLIDAPRVSALSGESTQEWLGTGRSSDRGECLDTDRRAVLGVGTDAPPDAQPRVVERRWGAAVSVRTSSLSDERTATQALVEEPRRVAADPLSGRGLDSTQGQSDRLGLDRRQRELEQAATALAAQRSQLISDMQILETTSRALATDRRWQQEEWRQLEVQRAEVARTTADLDLERHAVTTRARELDLQDDALAGGFEQLDLERQQVHADRIALDGEREKFDEWREGLEDWAERLSLEAAELEAARSEMVTARATLDVERREMYKFHLDLNGRAERLSREAAELETARAEVAAERATLDSERGRFEEWGAELEAWAERLAQEAARLDATRAELTAERAELESEVAYAKRRREEETERLSAGRRMLEMTNEVLNRERASLDEERLRLRAQRTIKGRDHDIEEPATGTTAIELAGVGSPKPTIGKGRLPPKRGPSRSGRPPAPASAKRGAPPIKARATGSARSKPPRRSARGPKWVPPVGDTCPPSHPVKARLASALFHLPGMAAYARTRPDKCFCDEAAATAAGFRRAKR